MKHVDGGGEEEGDSLSNARRSNCAGDKEVDDNAHWISKLHKVLFSVLLFLHYPTVIGDKHAYTRPFFSFFHVYMRGILFDS